MKALSVDDRDENLYFLEAVLRSAGFEVINAHNGEEAVELLDTHRFDLIISDVLMPKMDGFQLCREVRSRSAYAQVPFVFYSGSYTSPKDAELARRLGGTRYLIKPIEPERLVKILTELCDQNSECPTPAPVGFEDETVFLRTHNERLSNKLEEKIVEYEQMANRLQSAFDEKVREIAERQSIEQTLRRNEERYRTVVDSLAEGILLADSSGLVVTCNDSACRILGLSRQSLTSGPLAAQNWCLILEDGTPIPAEQHPLLDCLAKGQGHDLMVLGIQRREMPPLWISATTRPCQRDARGHTSLAVMSFTDITKRLADEQRIREQAHIIDNSHDAIVITDENGTVRHWNRGAENLYGWTTEEAIGKKEWQLFAHLPYVSPLRKLTEKGAFEAEYRHVTKTHRELIVLGRFTPILNAAKQTAGVMAFYFDITEKKQLEEQFLRAQRLESIGILAGGVAHDLNNILAPILLAVPVVRMRMQDPQGLTLLDTVEASATRGAQIVRQILNFSRGLHSERSQMQIRHLLKEIAEIIQETFPRNIVIETDLPRTLRTINGDSTQLHQVFMNLCVNARDAMPRGGTLAILAENMELTPEEAATLPGSAAPGPYVRVCVSDTGTGIPEELQEKLFEPFFTTKEVGKGTGLGLSTVRNIVGHHNGFVTLESKPGKGSRFFVHLPSSGLSSDLEPTKAGALQTGQGQLILVIDDEFAIRHICEELLTASGYQVISAETGQKGLALLRERQPEISAIITDLLMPGMSGTELIPLARGLKPTLKIIAISGTIATRTESQNPPGVLADAFLNKPFAAAQFLKTVHEVLHERRERH